MGDDAKHADGVVLPVWLARTIAAAVCCAALGAAGWASKIASDVNAIKVELRAANEMRATELGDVKRRLDRIEGIMDKK